MSRRRNKQKTNVNITPQLAKNEQALNDSSEDAVEQDAGDQIAAEQCPIESGSSEACLESVTSEQEREPTTVEAVDEKPADGSLDEVKTEDAVQATDNAADESLGASEEKNADAATEVKPKKKKLPKWLRRLIKLLIKLAVLAGAGFVLWQYVGNVYITHSNNMYPHIKDGDLVVTYKLKGYYSDNVVLYNTESGLRVGRIVARGGDEVLMTEDGLYTVNGSIPYENVFEQTLPAKDGGIEYPYVIPEGTYFIMNDMRSIADDSRMNGAVDESDLRGVVQVIVRHRGM